MYFLEVQGKGKWLGPLLVAGSSTAVLSKLASVGTVLGHVAGKVRPGYRATVMACLLNPVLSFPKYKLSLVQTISVLKADRFACDQTQGRWSCENLRNEISLILKSEGEEVTTRPRTG